MTNKLQLPDFSFENKLWDEGYKYIGGVDEVGRGAFAGPVFAGCVIFAKNQNIEVLINDSKKMSPKTREIASIWVKSNSLSWGTGSASVSEIDNCGIVKATNMAFRRAILKCSIRIEYLLSDAFFIPHTNGIPRTKQTPIIKGDSKSLSIAAASIIAKVERDNHMINLSKNRKYFFYNWEKNKGYGTLEHRNALKKYGKTRLHRVSFLFKLS